MGYALDARMTQQLVMQALFRAVAAKRPGKGLIHHSDRGSQYCSRLPDVATPVRHASFHEPQGELLG